jgi:hypothetical protein
MTGKRMISPVTHRRGRLIDTYSRRLLVLHVSNDDQEREQGSEDNPNVNAHLGTSGRVSIPTLGPYPGPAEEIVTPEETSPGSVRPPQRTGS